MFTRRIHLALVDDLMRGEVRKAVMRLMPVIEEDRRLLNHCPRLSEAAEV